MHTDYDDISLTDNPILALSQCFADCKLPHTLHSHHCVVLEVNGIWQQYDIAFTDREHRFDITAPLPLDLAAPQQNSVHDLIGRMNADVPLGHFQFDATQNCIEYRYSLPASVLTSLDIETIEEIVEIAITALEILYPVAETLRTGNTDLETALDKYLYPAQGSA